VAGTILALLILHEGPPPAFLSNLTFEILISGSRSVSPCLDDVQDMHLKETLMLVSLRMMIMNAMEYVF
jgi:hypothetical protein